MLLHVFLLYLFLRFNELVLEVLPGLLLGAFDSVLDHLEVRLEYAEERMLGGVIVWLCPQNHLTPVHTLLLSS